MQPYMPGSQGAEICVLPRSPVMWEAEGVKFPFYSQIRPDALEGEGENKNYFTCKLSTFDLEAFRLC